MKSLQNRLPKVCYVPATIAGLLRLLFLFLRWPLTVLMRQTRQAVRAFMQPILLRCLCYMHRRDTIGQAVEQTLAPFLFIHVIALTLPPSYSERHSRHIDIIIIEENSNRPK
jgi:hypothetical protein